MSDPSGAERARPCLHVVLLAHLDTQWRWTERDSALRFLPDTVARNEALFDRFPGYVLSFEGAYRYRLLAEMHPELFAVVGRRVEQGQWAVAGPALEAFDANLPSPESILRQILYGGRWLARAFGDERVGGDLLLVDCFGFPATLPTLAVHAGLAGFSTQKLRKGDVVRVAGGVPFAYGVWRGPDGSQLLASLDSGEYGVPPPPGLARDADWSRRFAALALAGRPQRGLSYFGVGDKGGALEAENVARLAAEIDPAAPIDVRVGPSDGIFRATGPDERARLPVYQGDLLLRLHGTGCYSAQAGLKRWNRVNERLARAAEVAALLATRSGRPYPGARLERAWWRFLAHQMHDDLTGTAIPAAYRISLADEAIAANELAEILLDSLAAVARGLDLGSEGRPVLLFDPLGGSRTQPVEIVLAGPDAVAPADVVDESGTPVPFQTRGEAGRQVRVVALARTAATGCAPLFLRDRGASPRRWAGAVARADGRDLSNGRMRARFDEAGNLVSLVDRELGDELLAAPPLYESLPDRSRKYPAWEIDWRDAAAPPDPSPPRTLAVEILESGPVRAALRVRRELPDLAIVETWSLGAGAAHLEVAVDLAWSGRRRLVKLAFPLAASDETFLCDLGLGAAPRPLASEALYEVPAQLWAGIADRRRGLAVAVLSDTKSGWDHPRPDTLRLTLLHAPAASLKFRHQATQDHGSHRFRCGLAGFRPQDLAAGAASLADRFARPVLAYRVTPGSGERRGGSRRTGLLDLGPDAACLLALKRAEDDGRWIVRLREPGGAPRRVTLAVAAPVAGVTELDARERPRAADPPEAAVEFARGAGSIGAARVSVALRASSLRTLGLEVEDPPEPIAPPRTVSFALDGGGRSATRRGEADRRGFDGRGRSFPLELLPERLDDTPVPFDLSHLAAGRGARAGDGWSLELPAGAAEIWFLGASVAGGIEMELEWRGEPLRLRVPDWRAALATADSVRRGWRLAPRLIPGERRRAPLAWHAPHLHGPRGEPLAGERGMLFALRVSLAGGAGGPLRLPREPRLRLLAATLAAAPARPLAEAFDPLG